MNDFLPVWQEPRWQAEAHEWIRSSLHANGLHLSAAIEQPHLRPWSTVMTVPTNGGLFYFKASADLFAHETALTAWLADFRPQLLPGLLAVDPGRHWMLMRDAGTPIRQFIRAEKDISPWRKVLPLYVNLQKDLTPHVSELLQLGTPDRRLSKLPALFESLIADESSMLLDTEDGLTSAEYARVKRSVPEFKEMCGRLAAFNIPETLHHDDFHDGNIFSSAEGITFTDWGESAVTHPFFTLVVMLRSVDNSLGLDFSPGAEQVRGLYLQAWAPDVPPARLPSLLDLAGRIGCINRALTWKMVIDGLPGRLKPEYAPAVPSYIRDFINAAG